MDEEAAVEVVEVVEVVEEVVAAGAVRRGLAPSVLAAEAGPSGSYKAAAGTHLYVRVPAEDVGREDVWRGVEHVLPQPRVVVLHLRQPRLEGRRRRLSQLRLLLLVPQQRHVGPVRQQRAAQPRRERRLLA